MLYLLKFVSISSQQPSTQRSEARGGTQPRPRLPSRLIQHTQFFFSSITGDSKELFRLDKTLSRDIAVSFSTQLSQLIQYKHQFQRFRGKTIIGPFRMSKGYFMGSTGVPQYSFDSPKKFLMGSLKILWVFHGSFLRVHFRPILGFLGFL